MYAKYIKDGIISSFSRLPIIYKNVIGFDKLDQAEHRAAGFFPVVFPEISSLQKFGALEFVPAEQIFRYKVIDKTPEEIEQENNAVSIEDQISELQQLNAALIEILNEKGIL